MTHSKRGFSSILVIILVIVIAGAGYYLYSKNTASTNVSLKPDTSSNGYYSYTNTVINYTVQVPNGWGIVDEETQGKSSAIFLYPSPDKHIDFNQAGDIRLKEEKGISVTPMTAKDSTTLKTNFDKITKIGIPYILANKSPIIQEIKLIASDEPVAGFYAEAYWVRTSSRAYSVEIGAKNKNDLSELRRYSDMILSTLAE
jgi:hypothetical protein